MNLDDLRTDLPSPTVHGPHPNLRAAAAEALLAGALLLSDVARKSESWNDNSQAKQSEERMRKALEALENLRAQLQAECDALRAIAPSGQNWTLSNGLAQAVFRVDAMLAEPEAP